MGGRSRPDGTPHRAAFTIERGLGLGTGEAKLTCLVRRTSDAAGLLSQQAKAQTNFRLI